MGEVMTQPKIARYYRSLSDDNFFGSLIPSYDEKSMQLLDKLFHLLEAIKPSPDYSLRSLWLTAPRGKIEDFGDAQELIEDGEIESAEELRDMWECEFPDETRWYAFSAFEDKSEGRRIIYLNHNIVILQDDSMKKSAFPNGISEFVQWLLDSVTKCIAMLNTGCYNAFINDNLPPQHKTGTIARKDYWNVWPENRAEFFMDISEADINEFCTLAYAQDNDRERVPGALQTMTANDFYGFCAIGYAANGYDGCDKPPKEQYRLHADRRDEGLSEIAPDSHQAFSDWLEHRSPGGHPWEVCRGGSSTHISLYVGRDEKGYRLTLAGSASTRTIETVKFYLALRRAGVPVYLRDAGLLADRLRGEEKIGIVPEGIMPAYCVRLFPNENIIDFMNLPEEDRERFLPYCQWQPIEPTHLLTEQ